MPSRSSRTPHLAALLLPLLTAACVPEPTIPLREVDLSVPARFDGSSDVAPASSWSAAELDPRAFFSDPHLNALIDATLQTNQELGIAALEVYVHHNEVLERRGEYLPKAHFGGGGGLRRKGEDFVTDENERDDGEYVFGLFATWELDIWGKLRDATDAASQRYLASGEGRRFLETQLVAEVADAYYELMTLDNQLAVLERNIDLQREALEIVRLQKRAGRVSELAVQRFEAEVLQNRSRRYLLRQRIFEIESQLNLLAGRFRQAIPRASDTFMSLTPNAVEVGVPADLLRNRPDIRRAELLLQAAHLDVDATRKAFYPSVELNAGVAVQTSFEITEVPSSPVAFAYHLLAELTQPLWNRNALKAAYFTANAQTMTAVLDYERTVIRAFTEVTNQLAMVDNLRASYALKTEAVEHLTTSIEISTRLFQSARADYMEVLLTRRDALEAQMERIETQGDQMKARVGLYRALGGGWERDD